MLIYFTQLCLLRMTNSCFNFLDNSSIEKSLSRQCQCKALYLSYSCTIPWRSHLYLPRGWIRPISQNVCPFSARAQQSIQVAISLRLNWLRNKETRAIPMCSIWSDRHLSKASITSIKKDPYLRIVFTFFFQLHFSNEILFWLTRLSIH